MTWTRDPVTDNTWDVRSADLATWPRDDFTDAAWQIPPTPPFIRVTMESIGGDRIRITEDGTIRIVAYETVDAWQRADFADAFWTKE